MAAVLCGVVTGLPVHGMSRRLDAVADPVFEAILVNRIKENTANDRNKQISHPFHIITMFGGILRSDPIAIQLILISKLQN